MRIIIIICALLSSFQIAFANQQTVGIFAYKNDKLNHWDPSNTKIGINGSEEAIIYMSEKLALLGYKVCVFADPFPDSIHSAHDANPRYVDAEFNDGTIFDIAISWRIPYNSQVLKQRARSVFLWPHDSNYIKLSSEQINGFDDVLWLSEWQRQQWVAENPEFAKFKNIFGNGINPEQFKRGSNKNNPYSCIYGSNYARGLEILLDIWPKIKEKFPQASLDIYYGWIHWGLLTDEKEASMRSQVSDLAKLDVQEHGSVGHEELNRAYEAASLWTYPCIQDETFCITGLRAQLAGAIPVITERSALKETVRSGFKCASSDEYYNCLVSAMQNIENIPPSARYYSAEF
jgi:glycosyltransferase involved in cell wall biosynthesis